MVYIYKSAWLRNINIVKHSFREKNNNILQLTLLNSANSEVLLFKFYFFFKTEANMQSKHLHWRKRMCTLQLPCNDSNILLQCLFFPESTAQKSALSWRSMYSFISTDNKDNMYTKNISSEINANAHTIWCSCGWCSSGGCWWWRSLWIWGKKILIEKAPQRKQWLDNILSVSRHIRGR